jgi:hypothetical protein
MYRYHWRNCASRIGGSPASSTMTPARLTEAERREAVLEAATVEFAARGCERRPIRVLDSGRTR